MRTSTAVAVWAARFILSLSVFPLLSQTCPQPIVLRQETCPSGPSSCVTGGAGVGGGLTWQQLDRWAQNILGLCNSIGQYTWPSPSSGFFQSDGSGSVTITSIPAGDSSVADFLKSGALTCGASTQGKIKVHTTPLQYCDNSATPTLRYSAYGDSSGNALGVANDSVALGTKTTGNYAAGDAEAGNATGLACTTCVDTTDIANDAVTYAKIQNVSSGKLLGRSTAGSGDTEEITPGTGLSLSGGTLTVTVSGASGDVFAYKASNQGITSSTTFTSDTALTVTLASSSSYACTFTIYVNPSTAAGWKYEVSGTATFNNIEGVAILYDIASAGILTTAEVTALDTQIDSEVGSTPYFAKIDVNVEVNSGGTFLLKWAQNTSSINTTFVKRGSSVVCRKLV